jgi:peptide chain release factor 2
VSLFDIVNLGKELTNLENQTMDENFWNNQENSTKVLAKIKKIKNKYAQYKKIENEIVNLLELTKLVQADFDEELKNEILANTKNLKRDLEKLEIETLLSGKYDCNNAIITIHPGAGGTESQDWAEMLYRMYLRWANKNNYKVKELDYLEGEEAGLKSVTFEVSGENAYGYLKGEKGVHRLVRISPFDSGGRRHTSFASVEILPEITDDIQIQINPDDLRIDTYRASRSWGSTYK